MKRREQEGRRRAELARRDAEAVLASLCRNQSSTFRLGDWLNLIARAEHDTDLAPLAAKIDEGFQASLREQIKRELASGRQLFNPGTRAARWTRAIVSGR